MMYPRLRLLREFLRHDGVFYASCDGNELHNFRIICDEIFGARNHAATFVWNTEGNTDNQLQIKVNHEYILTYYANKKFRELAIGHVIDPNTPNESNLRAGFADNNITKNGNKNPPSIIKLPVGFPSSEPNFSFKKERVDDEFFEVTSSDRYISREVQQRYSISQIPVRLDDMNVKDGELLNPCRLYSGWANARKLQEFINNGCSPLEEGEDTIHFYLNQNGCIRYRKTRISARNILSVLRGLGTTEKSKTILRKMGVNFDYPKPVPLLKYLISIGASAANSIVMDSFAGSGTTAQAVMDLNAEEAVSRKFILVEMDGKIATDAAAKRLNKVSAGYEYLEKNGKAVKVSGVGGGFRFCRLGVPLFDEFGDIADAVTFSDLAAHIFFSETGVPIPHRAQSEFLGIHQGRAVYLLFNEGNREVPQEAAGNVLTPDRLDRLPPSPDGFEGSRVVYAEGCTVSADRLKAAGVIFKQIPYQVEGV